LIGTRHAIDAAKRAIMEKVDTVVSYPFSHLRMAELILCSVPDHKLVNPAMTLTTTTRDISSNNNNNLLPDTPLPQPRPLSLVHRHQLLEQQIHTQHMVDIKIIYPCGMQLWPRNSKVVKVKVSNDRRPCGVDRDLARDCGLCLSMG